MASHADLVALEQRIEGKLAQLETQIGQHYTPLAEKLNLAQSKLKDVELGLLSAQDEIKEAIDEVDKKVERLQLSLDRWQGQLEERLFQLARGELDVRFWLFIVGAAATYGCMVPLWFLGAKHIALKWQIPLASADALMLVPEGVIALVAPTLGVVVNRPARMSHIGIASDTSGWYPANISRRRVAMLSDPTPNPANDLLGDCVGFTLSGIVCRPDSEF